jgi:putative ABC transport system substrate-binding protein
MQRREFITLFGGAAAAWPISAWAQQPAMPVVGILSTTSAEADAYLLAPFLKSVSEAGFDEGRNVAIEYRFAQRDVSRLPALSAELVSRNVTVVYTATTISALALKAATSTIPIVFAVGADPVKLGLVASLNRPGGNITGVSFFTNQMEAKRLGLLHELVPKVDLVAVLLNPNNPFFENQSSDLNAAARVLGVKIHIEHAKNEDEIAAAFVVFARQRAGALLVGADPFYNSRRVLVVAPAARYGLPAIYEWREFAEAGGLMSYGTRLTDAYRQAGEYVGRVLKGVNPAELPVLQSTKFELVINLKTAKALGLDVPVHLQQIADEVIE